MKFRTLIAAIIFSGSFGNALVHAAEWSSEAELGIVVTDGNTETQNTNGKISATRKTEKWKHATSLEALGASSTDTTTGVKSTTAEKYTAKLQSDYNFTTKDFMYLSGKYDDDRFSGYEYQATVSIGYGRHIIQSDKQELTVQVGPGMRYFKVSPFPRVPSDEEAILHGQLNYLYNITDTSKFTQDVIVDAGEDVTITESITALSAQVSGKLAMKTSLKIKNSSDVPAGSEDTDTEAALTLVYSIK